MTRPPWHTHYDLVIMHIHKTARGKLRPFFRWVPSKLPLFTSDSVISKSIIRSTPYDYFCQYVFLDDVKSQIQQIWLSGVWTKASK